MLDLRLWFCALSIINGSVLWWARLGILPHSREFRAGWQSLLQSIDLGAKITRNLVDFVIQVPFAFECIHETLAYASIQRRELLRARRQRRLHCVHFLVAVSERSLERDHCCVEHFQICL